LLDDAHSLQQDMSAEKSGTAVVLPINTKKLVISFKFFQKWRIFLKKCNKSQNIPNMKTKIFSYPSIVGYIWKTKLRNQAIFSLLAIKALKKLSISIFKNLFLKKLD
jgi:hypothetical protein